MDHLIFFHLISGEVKRQLQFYRRRGLVPPSHSCELAMSVEWEHISANVAHSLMGKCVAHSGECHNAVIYYCIGNLQDVRMSSPLNNILCTCSSSSCYLVFDSLFSLLQ